MLPAVGPALDVAVACPGEPREEIGRGGNGLMDYRWRQREGSSAGGFGCAQFPCTSVFLIWKMGMINVFIP